jgi:hypothetical protein
MVMPPALLAPGSALERQFVRVALPLLSMQRRVDYERWMKVGFAVGTVFNGDEQGRDLFRLWSGQAPNYDQAACDRKYLDSGSRVGIGSLIAWLREDASPALAGALVQLLNPADVEDGVEMAAPRGSKLDEGEIHEMVRLHNVARQERHADPANRDKTAAAKKREDAEQMALLHTQIVKYMNQWFCIIRRSTGKPNVIEEYQRSQRRMESDGHDVVTMFSLRSPTDATAAYLKHTLQIAGQKTPKTPMDIWLRHRDAREYDSIDFIPSSDPHQDDNGVFNLFRGLAITKELAACSLGDATPILEHIRDIWCRGDMDAYRYLMSWMAHLIQQPGVKMMTAPVLKGGQGAGKGIIIQMLGDILGAEHFLGVRNVDAVTGSFQEDKVKTNLLTFLDEATFAGDKRQAAILKGLVSESVRRWEAKFVNPIRIANHSNYIVASNYDQIVYVEEDDRRWFCLEVDSKYSGTQTPESKLYFDKLLAVPTDAFAKALYEHDLTGFNPRAPPSSSYQRHQKAINFGTVTSFVEHAIRSGSFAAEAGDWELMHDAEDAKEDAKEDAGDTEDAMMQPVRKKAVYEAYKVFCSGRNVRRTEIDQAFFKKLFQLLPGLKEHRSSRADGRMRMVTFPPLSECQVQFIAAIHEKQWDWE